MLRWTLAAATTTKMVREIVQAALARENQQRMDRFGDRGLPGSSRQVHEPTEA